MSDLLEVAALRPLHKSRAFGAGTDDALLAGGIMMIGWLSFVVEVVALSTSLKIRMFGAGTDDALLPGNSVVAVGLTPLVEVLVKDKGGNEADFELSC